MEEVPLYGNLHYLQTGRKLSEGSSTVARVQGEEQEVTRFLFPVLGRLSQEPGPDQQNPTPGGPARVSQLWLKKRGGKVVGDFSRVQ